MIHTLSHNYPNLIGGVVTHASNFFRELEKFFPSVHTQFEPNKTPSIKQYDADIHINLTMREYWHLLNDGKFKGKKIGYPIFEWTNTTDIEKVFENHDQIWVATHWHKSNFTDQTKVKIIPEGVNPVLFNPKIKPNSLIKFKFLCVARPDIRKNVQLVIEAFLEEFANDNDVLLFLENLFPDYRMTSHPKVIQLNSFLDHSLLGQFYTACDAFVLPSKVEGWGLPITEAMACGLPTITTNYSGMTEYCNENNTYFVNHTLEDIDTNYINVESAGKWASVDKEHLKYLMRYIYSHRDEAKCKGEESSKYILENFTWK